MPPEAALTRLLKTIAALRAGCPWDQEQTPESLCPYLLEEAAEVVAAIESGNQDEILEELGDLLLQIVLQAQIFSESEQFDFAAICERLTEKMIYRHPHVFGSVAVSSSAEVISNWEHLKTQEKPVQTVTAKLRQLPKNLSALSTAHKISRKVAQVGFEWSDLSGVLAKVKEEIAELEGAIAQESPLRQSEELGDVLFSLVNVARWQKIDSETALRETNRRFLNRFALVEALAERPLETYSIVELEQFWQTAKQQLKTQE